MADEGFTVTAEFVLAVRELWQFYQTQEPQRRLGRKVVYPSNSGGLVIGRLTSAMTAASNWLTGATSFTFVRGIVDGDVSPQTDPKTLKERVDADGALVEDDGVNRSKYTGNVGDIVWLARVNGEWHPIFLDPECPSD